MKIGILTQSINNNYGGILQNYALQTILRRMGHEVVTLNWDFYRCDHANETWSTQLWIVLKTFLKRVILRQKLNYPWEEKQFFYQLAINNRAFTRQHLNLSKWLWGKQQFRQYTVNNGLEVLIVGSDQTWRPCYNRNGMLFRMFLDFTTGLNIKRLAYAASFGVDDWEYNNKETIACTELLKAFDAVSVREESGISLCQQHLKRTDAIWVLDPTLLLDKKDYTCLFLQKEEVLPTTCIATYILDNTPEKERMIQLISKTLNMKVSAFAPKYCHLGTVNQQTIGEYISPSVLEWLRAFHNAKYVICDSFHGTVFSIIFNKQFITIGNHNRGMGRFLSLLKQFGLENRLIGNSPVDIMHILDSPIEWTTINVKLQTKRKQSIKFLKEALES